MKPKQSTQPWFSPLKMLLMVLVTLLIVLLLGCETPPPPLQPEPVPGVRPPPLSQAARQPATPSECLPTCLDGLTRERSSWQTLLDGAGLPGLPANANTTPSTGR